ncbi:MAG: LysR family transcriptional regulator [Oliverpabstia sp.]
MELRVLEYYLMVAREENITKAAELLHITQPTLSRQLAQLEEELGVRLFKRGKHNISLTEDGMLLKRRAQELVDLADKTKEELRHDEENIGGTISIGSGETKSIHIFADWLAEFHKVYPQVTFDIYSSTADQIKERIEKGLIDIGLLTEPVEVGKYQFIRLPEKIRWGVLVRRDSVLSGKSSVTAKDLWNMPVLIPWRDSVRNELANWFMDDYEKLNIVGTYNLIYNAAVIVESIHGAALCMELDQMYQNLVFIPLEPTLATGSVLVWKKNQFVSPLMQRFTEYLRNAAKAFNDI